MLTNCAPRTQKSALPIETNVVFSQSGEEARSDQWWTSFGDPLLNTLVDSALSANVTLKTAWHRLRAAQAVTDREAAAYWPFLEATGQGDVSRMQSEHSETENSEQFQLGLSAVYEVDLWGRIRSGVAAQRFRAQATYADYQTAAISLSAEITRTWFQLMEARNQVALIDEQIATNERVLQLIRTRFGSGQIRSADILRQQQLVESTREQKTYADANVNVLEHRLAVLLGQPPQQQIDTTLRDLPSLPPLPETGVPLELVRRRPDVQSAHLLLQAADRDMAVAISNQYPRLSLTASTSSMAERADNLFKDWIHSLAGNLLAPIFYGGELRAEVNRTEAEKQQRLFEYAQTVLVAFREVEDALILEQNQAESIASIAQQLELARQSYEQLRIEYFNGLSNYLDVLTAIDNEQQLQRGLLSARLSLIEYRIALYRALAGGFETARELN